MIEHTIEIYPGRDQRAANNGFTTADILFILTDDDDGVVTFNCLTNWLPAGMQGKTIPSNSQLRPLEVTFHFPTDTLTARQDTHDNCPYLGGPCHSITNHRVGDTLVDILLARGTEGLWMELEKLYRQEAKINRPLRRD